MTGQHPRWSHPGAVVAAATTALFVPGDRPDRIRKAAASGADVVIVDLEDAVAPAAKSNALSSVLAALTPDASEPVSMLVRVNAADAPTYPDEIAALVDLTHRPGHGLLGMVLPKVEDVAAAGEVLGKLDRDAGSPLAIVLLVETALGIARVPQLTLLPGVTRLALGAIDLALDVDADADSVVIDYARAALVLASRVAAIAAPWDSPSTQIADIDAVAAAARRARRDGFGGQLCIHPRQLGLVASAFQPTAAQISWATSVLAAGDAAAQVDGQMVDRPVAEKARRVLQRAGEQDR